ncbi:MAG TPA: glycosyltransferase family 4 protein [Candidatus Binatia bacterium]|nr:glycosyltransferase family 4 protein [Candidatus Binatia bacterium]
MDGGTALTKPLRIGIVAPPLVRIPPKGYAGTERVVAAIAIGLHERGHEVTVFASGDSDLPCAVVPVVPHSLWSRNLKGDLTAYLEMSVALAWEQAARFDVIHSHVEQAGFLMARHCGTPVLSTLHKRVDVGGVAELIDLMPDVPLVAISESQRRWNPDANWIATIHHGLDFTHTPMSPNPGGYLLLVGRVSHDKGIVEAIEVARRTGMRLVMAAKVYDREEIDLFEAVVKPAIAEGIVDWRGEVDGEERDRLMAGAYATLMLGAWPEPFGLVAIESMATGTPVIARRAGGVTETVEHGLSGYLVDDVHEAILAIDRVAGLRRERIAAYARGRFSVERMLSRYEQAYLKLLEQKVPAEALPEPKVAVGPGREAAPNASAVSAASKRTVGASRAADAGGTVRIAPVADLGRARRHRSVARESERREAERVEQAGLLDGASGLDGHGTEGADGVGRASVALPGAKERTAG